MNEQHFLTELKIYLRPLQPRQIEAILMHYHQIFQEKKQEGLSEPEISASLAAPKDIAKKILNELGFHNVNISKKRHQESDWQELTDDDIRLRNQYDYEQYFTAPPKRTSFTIKLLKWLGLLAFNLFFFVWILVGIFFMIGSFWLLVSLLLASPFVTIILPLWESYSFVWLQLFVSLVLFGIGLIGAVIMRYITSYFFKFVRHYIRAIKSMLKGTGI
ncbi:DUF1700 domain-containing protein [Vagococcus sp.]|uniref:DUF1700 domain-containing protein n=1 Tax=Vagococcus sp. TaxID=1933889 RepID=UPI000EF08AB1|nr:DUF1700 domain-containing protein [Vagococcus sp.]HCT95449.1 hypothetical protein [Vagococcus sp.]